MKALLTDQQKQCLLKLARDTISLYIKESKIFEYKIDDEALGQVMGVFVTLNNGDKLRGCIGNIIGTTPLCQGVRDMAIACATKDPRFDPLVVSELDKVSIEISVLSPLEKISDPAEIILGKHGVLVEGTLGGGVYLPQVATETGWSKDEFMNSLCAHKAGIAPDAWKRGECDIYIFTAEVFGE
tara:strand:+ start:247 stop:798 length:552 start_codon:yes stop_codon:yes gene_type:complete